MASQRYWYLVKPLIHVTSHFANSASISDSPTLFAAQNLLANLYLDAYVGHPPLSDLVDDPTCAISLTTSLAQIELAASHWQNRDADLTDQLLIDGFLGQARACVSLGRLDEAWINLTLASYIAEKAREAIRTEKLKLLYSESIQRVYDEMIAFQWEQRHDGRYALAIAEKARAFPQPTPVQDGGKAREDGVTLAYALLPDRLLIWVITEEGVSTFERRVPARRVETRVTQLLGQIRRSGPELRNISGELHDLLIPEPVTEMARDRVLYFVPDRVLNKVPFAALQNPRTGRFLVQDHPVALARSVARLGKSSQEPQSHPSFLVVGNPAFDRKSFPDCATLNGAQAETALVTSSLPNCRLLTGNGPTSERVLGELDRVDTFIFIGHSVTDSNEPSRSCLLLAPSAGLQDTGIFAGEKLASRKFENLRLVVLSGCSTVGPTSMRSRRFAGMAGRFLDAGAHTVVGTLWSLNDARTLSVLAPFYREIAKGRPAVSALHDAQIAALEEAPERVADWADFVAVVN